MMLAGYGLSNGSISYFLARYKIDVPILLAPVSAFTQVKIELDTGVHPPV